MTVDETGVDKLGINPVYPPPLPVPETLFQSAVFSLQLQSFAEISTLHGTLLQNHQHPPPLSYPGHHTEF